MHSDGWESHIAVLDTDQVAEVARDLGSVDEGDVREMPTPDGGAYPDDGFERESEYVMPFCATRRSSHHVSPARDRVSST